MFTVQPTIGQCTCGRTFVRIPANKKHCSVRCAKIDERARRREKLQQETLEHEEATRPVPAGYLKDPTVALLALTEAMLCERAVPAGQTFCGNIPQWQPTDSRIDWCESATPGVWNMVFIG
jgi:predicted nucleic acid-binding Zn ribbon protein